jgi:adenine deaminase
LVSPQKTAGNFGLGAHGEQQGICAHWKLWAEQMGGLSNYDVLRVATVMGADGLGFLDNLGTIEAGKLADLIVLNANPLEDIRNSNIIAMVMKNGELFEGDTLRMQSPEERPAPEMGFPWADPAGSGGERRR